MFLLIWAVICISHPINGLDGYTFFRNKYCLEPGTATGFTQIYETLSDAKQKCDENNECAVITDYSCKDDMIISYWSYTQIEKYVKVPSKAGGRIITMNMRLHCLQP